MDEAHEGHVGGPGPEECPHCLGQIILEQGRHLTRAELALKELVECYRAVMNPDCESYGTEEWMVAHNRRVDAAVAAAEACLE